MDVDERDRAVNFHKYTKPGQRIEPQIARIYVRATMRVMLARRNVK